MTHKHTHTHTGTGPQTRATEIFHSSRHDTFFFLEQINQCARVWQTGSVCACLTQVQDVIGLDEVFGASEGQLRLGFSLELQRERSQHEEHTNGLWRAHTHTPIRV